MGIYFYEVLEKATPKGQRIGLARSWRLREVMDHSGWGSIEGMMVLFLIVIMVTCDTYVFIKNHKTAC